MKIGVLDIQGSVEEHFRSLSKLANIKPCLIKKVEDLEGVSGLIIPGGESTTIGKLLRRFGLRDQIIRRAISSNPLTKLAVWGTCAGAILMAKKIVGKQNADTMQLMDITIERNAYGRQLDSFESQVNFDGKNIPAIFIRAPKICSAGKKVSIISRYDGNIIAAKENNLLVTTFHPEMTDSLLVHKYFADMCQKSETAV